MKENIIKEMCAGCGWVRGYTCGGIREPEYLHKNRGNCFAKATPDEVREIEREIEEQAKIRKRRG